VPQRLRGARPFPNGDTPLDLLLDNGTVYPHPGKFVLAIARSIRRPAHPDRGGVSQPGEHPAAGAVRAGARDHRGEARRAGGAATRGHRAAGSYQIAVVDKDDK